MGLSPLPVHCLCNFTTCCQGLWNCSWNILVLLWERLKADLSPGSPDRLLHSLSTRRNNKRSVQSQVPWLRSCSPTALPLPLHTAAPRCRSVPVPLSHTTQESCCFCSRQDSLGQQRGNDKICFNAPFFCHFRASHVTLGRYLNVHPTTTH